MKSAILTIGDELLGGYTLDSNGAWIGRKLMDIGIRTIWKTSMGDIKGEIVEAMALAANKADIVICTGGLGPTRDDVTMDAYCEFTGATLETDEDYLELLRERFSRRGVDMPKSNLNQGHVPDRGTVIPNSKGSARGMSCTVDGAWLCILPGVPAEMKSMMEETVLPELEQISPSELIITNIRTTGVMESKLHDLLEPAMEESVVNIAFVPSFSGVDLRLTAGEESAVTELASNIYDLAGKYIYAEDWVTLEQSVGESLREKGLMLALAESCTGGLLGDRITNVPGSSEYFAGSVICYSDKAKINLVGVKSETLKKYGAVSEETAAEMAAGVRKVFDADIGVSITGIAGPGGGTDEKPVGFTCFGLDDGEKPFTRSVQFYRDRRFNKELSAQTALNSVRLRITGQI
jgi:nicotinamide-nucleotide amidase